MTEWRIQRKLFGKWKTLDFSPSQHQAEQLFFKTYGGIGRIISPDGLTIITERKENLR